jgi:hypothetical protein
LEQQEQQRVEDAGDHDHQGQAPVVDHHDGEDEGDLRSADQHPDAAPLHELGDGLDVGGDPRDQGAAPLGLDVEHGEVVDVPEGDDAQLGEAPGGELHEPELRDPVGDIATINAATASTRRPDHPGRVDRPRRAPRGR